MAKGRRSGAEREALKRQRSRQAQRAIAVSRDESIDELFARLRSGAANVAGVTYQTNLATLLLASGRAQEPGMPRIVAVRPEGFEDIDCRLDDGRWLLIQSKQRATRIMGRAEIAQAIAHAGQVEATRDYDGNVAGYAIVSNIGFSVESTGWSSTLSNDDVELTEALQSHLVADGRNPANAQSLIARTHLIVIEDPFVAEVESMLTRAYSIPPAVAVLVRSHLSADLAAASSAQRGREVDTAHVRDLANLDAMVSRLRETIDFTSIDAAIREGVCEFADFSDNATETEEQFFLGVRVVPSHIGSDRDVVRVQECESILQALEVSRHVLLVGPSGTGKSGLLWRATFMLQSGPMLIRVLRVETESDAQSLIRYIRSLSPGTRRRVLVCVDDLGRTSTEAWPSARDRLLEMQGVSILGACRQEDLLPSIAIGARLVDCRLKRESAERIYDRLRSAGLHLRMEPEEAIQRAEGLLMEFVALATTGHRLREVLRSQVERIDGAGDVVARDVLSVVTALHTLGRSVSADELPELIGQQAAVISRHLAQLRDEHLVVTDDGVSWRSLHDLRAEVLLEVLHEVPPPSLAATYARSIVASLPDARPALYRRAATRVLRGTDLEAVPAGRARLEAAHRAIKPLVNSIAERVRELANAPGASTAAEIAALVDAAERLDVAAYAAATLDYVQKAVPSAVDVSTYYLLAFSSKFSAVFEGNHLFRRLVKVGAGLPEWDSSARRSVLGGLSTEVVTRVLSETDLDVAVRFGERLEGYVTVPAPAVTRIYSKHLAGVDGMRVDGVDVLAQLVATLANLAELHGQAIEEAFGPVHQRATWAVETDEAGYSVEVAFLDKGELPCSPSNLTRTSTYSGERFCEVSAKALPRLLSDTVRRGYQLQEDQDPTSLNAQAVFLAQRLFDACPEADVVSVDVSFPRLPNEPRTEWAEGLKRMRAGVIPRRVTTERSIAVQVAVKDLLSAERWTDRCRSQAVVSAELVSLLTSLPARLAKPDSFRGRREWIDDVTSSASLVAQLPGLPIDGQLLERLNSEFPFAADFDQKLRHMMRDPSKRALELIAECLQQVAQELDDPSNLVAAGNRLAGALKALAAARADRTLPEYAAVGPLLPTELDQLASMASRALVARGQGLITPEELHGKALSEVDSLASLMAAEVAKRSLAALEQRLKRYGVNIVATSTHLAPDASDPVNNLQLTIAIDAASWAETEEALRSWSEHERNAAEFATRSTIVATHAGRLIQVGAVLGGATARLRPIDPTQVSIAAGQLQLPLAGTRYQEKADNLIGQLAAVSITNMRRRLRPSSWRDIEVKPNLPEVEATSSDPQPWREALNVYGELKHRVEHEDVEEDSLAAALAAADLSSVDSLRSPILRMIGNLRALAIDADLAVDP